MDTKRVLEEVIATLLDGCSNDIEVFYKTPFSNPTILVRTGRNYKKYKVRVDEV